MISVLVDKFIRTQIVDCAAVANWVFSPEMAHDFTRYTSETRLHVQVRRGSCNWFMFIGSMQVLCVGDSSFNHPKDEQTCAEDPERARWGKRKAGEATEQKGRRETFFTAKTHVRIGFAVPLFRTDCPHCYFCKGLSCIICLDSAVNIQNVYIGCCINTVGVGLTPTDFLIQQFRVTVSENTPDKQLEIWLLSGHVRHNV